MESVGRCCCRRVGIGGNDEEYEPGGGGGSGRFNAEKCCSNEASSGCHE